MIASAVREVLESTQFCIIATATPDGRPWVSPVFFNYDGDCRLVWESANEALHSQLIARNPRIAVVVADFAATPAVGAYFECTAREVPAEGLAAALDVFLNGPHAKRDRTDRTVDDYGGTSRLRLYEAVPERAYLLDRTTDAAGHVIERHIEVALTE